MKDMIFPRTRPTPETRRLLTPFVSTVVPEGLEAEPHKAGSELPVIVISSISLPGDALHGESVDV
jgi:hypothetical protein